MSSKTKSRSSQKRDRDNSFAELKSKIMRLGVKGKEIESDLDTAASIIRETIRSRPKQRGRTARSLAYIIINANKPGPASNNTQEREYSSTSARSAKPTIRNNVIKI